MLGAAGATRVEAVEPVDGPAWDRYVAANEEAQLYHFYSWRGVIEDVFRRKCHYLAAFDEDRTIRGILPLVHLKSLMFGNFLVSLPYFNYGGVLADSPQVADVLLSAASDLARERRVDHVELRHMTDAFPRLPRRTDKVSMELQLPADEDALWRTFSGKLRTQIRRPLQEGATTENGSVELLDDFYRVFARNMRDLGTPVYPAAFFETIARRFSDNARVFVVRIGNEPVAAGFVLAHRKKLEIPWASSLRSSNRYGVNMLLYWSILQWSISRGLRLFDFGRCTKDGGTFRFKQQWGAQPLQHYWHYLLPDGSPLPRLNPENGKFRLAVRAWQRLPLALANFVGPHLVRNLP